MTDHQTLINRILAGRKNVVVGLWKWDVPQTITTIDRVPLPPQRVPLPPQRVEGRTLMGFANYLNTNDDEHQTAGHKERTL